jgi:ribonuclease HII
MAAAAILYPPFFKTPWASQIRDSKKTTSKMRAELFEGLCTLSKGPDPVLVWALGEASVQEIDQLNIRQATLLAMKRAVQALRLRPKCVLVDGRDVPPLDIPAQAIVKGDAAVPAISAASLLAKHTRDQHMITLARTYPHYGWEKNAGYGTHIHHQALKNHGPSPYHRRSFRPVRELLLPLER